MTPELENAFYELLAAARAVANAPLREGMLPWLDRSLQAIDELTDCPPTQRHPSVPAAAHPYHDPR